METKSRPITNLEYFENQVVNGDIIGCVLGLKRVPEPGCNTYRSHIYTGTFEDVGEPLCPYGWNCDDGFGYSIWRGSVGRGVCKLCLRKAYRLHCESVKALRDSNTPTKEELKVLTGE